MKAKTKKQYKESWKRHVMELNSVGMDLMDITDPDDEIQGDTGIYYLAELNDLQQQINDLIDKAAESLDIPEE